MENHSDLADFLKTWAEQAIYIELRGFLDSIYEQAKLETARFDHLDIVSRCIRCFVNH
eukprot:gene40987-55397_t